jgi:hypothetical protein
MRRLFHQRSLTSRCTCDASGRGIKVRVFGEDLEEHFDDAWQDVDRVMRLAYAMRLPVPVTIVYPLVEERARGWGGEVTYFKSVVPDAVLDDFVVGLDPSRLVLDYDHL